MRLIWTATPRWKNEVMESLPTADEIAVIDGVDAAL
jgi:hypothetical protein